MNPLPLDLRFAQFIAQVSARNVIKSVLIALMVLISVATWSGSVERAIWVSTIALMLAQFQTWRRYLEPLSFIIFVITSTAICVPPDVLAHLPKLALN